MSETLIRGSKGGAEQHKPAETPDNLRSIAYFRILDLVSEGEIGGLVNGQQSIYLDETPLVNSDGTSNFPKAHVEARTGTQDQDAIPGFDSVENEISVGVELKSSAAWVQAISDITLSAIRLTIGVPALTKADTSNGDINGYKVDYKIEISTDGGAYVLALNGSFQGKTTTKFQRSHRLDLPAATSGWQIRVTRLTANANSSSIADTLTIDSYTEIVDAKLRYPNSALVAVMGDASQFSNIPRRAYDLFGRIIQVPSNYDVTTRAYTGTWDGTFKPSWTDNPAWIFYDLVTHPRYGLGHLVDAALVDKWELYRIGQYCDGMVDDGVGGQEPRLTCNIFLQTQADAYKLLNDLSTAFRGISYWANGTIVASADMPGDPVYTYTDANVIGGQFSYSASGRKTRYTTALVSWNDPRNFFRTKVEYVEDRDGIARYGVQQTAVTAVGCTSQAQAQRLGRWILLTSRLETDTVTFRVGLDGVLVAPGQVIRVADSARAGKRQGGRIVSATTTTVTLDKAPTVASGDTVTVGMPDGVSQTRTVLSVDGATVTTSTAFTDTPVAESAWTVESGTLAAQTFRVLSVTEDKSDTEISFTITALQHNASKFDAVDFGTLIQVPPISALTITNQAGPSAVSLESAEVVDPAATTKLLTIAWTAVPGAIAYEAEWRKDDGEWRSLGILTGLSADIRGAGAGDYVARVRAKGTGNAYSLFTYSNTYTLGAASTLPTTVADIQAEANQAASDASAANAKLADIASDNMLTPGEKPTVIRDYNVIITEQAGIDTQATAYGITTEKTTYDSKVAALTTYLGTLTSPTNWDDISGNTTIVGTTFRQKFADVYTSRQALLNAIYAAAKAKADAAQATANTGQALASQVAVINPGFDAGDTGWTKESGWSIKSDGSFGFGQGYAEKTGGASDAALRNAAVCYVQEGKSYKVQALIKAIGANGQCYARISWRDLNNAEIGVSNGNLITGTTVAGSFAVGQAPTGAVFAHAEIAATSHTAGTYQVDNVISTLQPATADEIDESSGRKWAADSGATNGFNKGSNLLRNPTGTAGFFGWDGGFVGTGQQTMTTRPDIPVGMAFACTVGATSADQGISQYVRSSSGISGVTFTVSGWFYTGYQLTGTHFIQIRQLDASGAEISGATRPAIQVPIGVSAWQYLTATFTTASGCYGLLVVARCTGTGSGGQNRWSQLKLEIGSKATPFNYTSTSGDQLGVGGSGAKLGNQLNAPNSLTLNFGAVRSATALAAASNGTVSVNAFTYYMGGTSVPYSAVANAVTGLSTGTSYYIYCHDPNNAGGAQTWLATTNVNALLQTYDDIVVAGQVTIPSSGTSSGGGSGDCVCDHMFVAEGMRAGEAREGDVFDCLDLPRLGMHKFRRKLHSVERRVVECVRLTTDGGAVWEGSASTPFDLPNGDLEWAPHMKGRQVVTDRGIETVVEVERVGPMPVSHIHLGGCSYAAGMDPEHRIYSHNPIMKK